MSASINDVAAQAGVSVATVSRALRGLPNVAPSTRRRVLAAATELEYVADPHASRLAAGRTQTVGMVVPLFSWFFTQVVAGSEGVLAAAGYDLMLYNVSDPESRRRFVDRMPFRKRVDGLILVDLPLDDAAVDRIHGTGLPVSAVGTRPRPFPSVTIDNKAAAALATQHLVNLGHSQIALVDHLVDDPFQFTVPRERRTGYQRVLANAGLGIRPELEVPGNFSYKGGAEAMAHLLSIECPPTAVFAESDEMAIGALRTVQDAGLRVPGDVSVIGFDDQDAARYIGLTTVAQPVMEQGEVAATLLLEQIRGRSENPPARVLLPTTLRVRNTTGPRQPAPDQAAPA